MAHEARHRARVCTGLRRFAPVGSHLFPLGGAGAPARARAPAALRSARAAAPWRHHHAPRQS
jgi:hypothetical protein